MILVYLGDEQQKSRILEELLQECNFSYRFLGDQDLTQTIGWLLNLDGYQKTTAKSSSHKSCSLMILDDVSDEEINLLNQKMKEKGISMPRKAMRTKHNESWLLQDLLQEIEAEHAYFQTLEELQKLLVTSSELVIEDYTPKSWKAYEAAFYQAYEVLQKQQDADIAKKALEQLQSAKAQLQYRL